ncbi:MAG: radical SAM protein, partial [Defluviitaleaceae bacterium]|nr:radical SAM protein [Defluviitaleaceae bacterium]
MYLFDFKSCELINKETLDIFTIDEEGGKILYNYLIEKEINVNTNELIKSLLENDIEIDKITLWDRNSFAPQTPIVHIIQNCNSPCTMCDCWKTKNSIFHTAESLDSVFRKLSNLGATSIMISGGEPLLHKELDTIIDKVHGYHMAVQLNSNGILLDKRASLYNKNIEALVVSMEGFNRDDYKTIRGTDKFEL